MVVISKTEIALRDVIIKYLGAIKMKPKLAGYKRMVVALELYCKNPERYNNGNIYTLLYDNVAEICDTANANVEKSIRKALEITWTKEYSEAQEELYGEIVSADKGKPTSKEFIIRTAEMIERDLNRKL